MSRFTVRPGAAEDADFLFLANQGLAKETEDKELESAVLRDGIRAALSDRGRGVYFVAETEGQPVGSLMVTREWSDWRNGWMWWIQSVYVVPERRRQGVYRHLHRHVVERAQAAGDVRAVRLYVDKANERAKKVYDGMGMTVSRYDLMEVSITSMNDDTLNTARPTPGSP